MKLLVTEKQLTKIVINEAPTADKVENMLMNIGIEIKGGSNGEFDNNGDITPEFANEFTEFMKDVQSCCVGCNIRVTAGNDRYHANSTSSKHPQGLAADFTIEPYTKGLSCINKNISKYSLHLIDEYKNPSERSTGGHFHVHYIGNVNSEKKQSDIPQGSKTKNTNSFGSQFGKSLANIVLKNKP